MSASATRIARQTRAWWPERQQPYAPGSGAQRLRSDGGRQHLRRRTRRLGRRCANRPLPAALAGIVRHRLGTVCRLFPGAVRLAAGTGWSRRWDVNRVISARLFSSHPRGRASPSPFPAKEPATAVRVLPCPLTRSEVASGVEGKRQADKQHAASGSRPLAPALARFSTGAVRPGGPPLAIRKGCSHDPYPYRSPARPADS